MPITVLVKAVSSQVKRANKKKTCAKRVCQTKGTQFLIEYTKQTARIIGKELQLKNGKNGGNRGTKL